MQVKNSLSRSFCQKRVRLLPLRNLLQGDIGPIRMNEVYNYRKVVDTCEFSNPNLIRYKQIKQWSSGPVFGIWGQTFHVRYQ